MRDAADRGAPVADRRVGDAPRGLPQQRQHRRGVVMPLGLRVPGEGTDRHPRTIDVDTTELGAEAVDIDDVARLGEALSQQREQVTLARNSLEAQRSQWREAAQRTHVVETLVERWQGEELRAANRRDQLECDELSQQQRGNKDRNT